MQIAGGIVIAVGAVLWCGNVFHFLPTFPLAGYLTMAAGGFIMKMGTKKTDDN